MRPRPGVSGGDFRTPRCSAGASVSDATEATATVAAAVPNAANFPNRMSSHSRTTRAPNVIRPQRHSFPTNSSASGLRVTRTAHVKHAIGGDQKPTCEHAFLESYTILNSAVTPSGTMAALSLNQYVSRFVTRFCASFCSTCMVTLI